MARQFTLAQFVRLAVLAHEVERVQDEISQVLSFDNRIEHPVFEQELGALKTFRQLLFYCLLDHARPGETDLRSRLGYVEVAEHREARSNSTGGRIGQHGNKRKPRFIQPRERY